MNKFKYIEEAIVNASNWILESGIQNITTNDPKINGSFNAWFETDTNNYPYIYSEITGYMVTMMCYLFDLQKDERLIERGKMGGEWLLNTAFIENGGFRCLFFRRHFGGVRRTNA